MANFLLHVLVLALCVLSNQSHGILTDSVKVYNVVDYGAVGDGLADDTQAFSDAWNATCQSSVSFPTMYVPQGMTFLLQPLTFNGSCKSRNITVQIDANIIAPSDPLAWKCLGNECHRWITFLNFNGLFISGSGTINGQGTNWWGLSCQQNKRGCGKKPTGFVIENSNNVHIDGLTFVDSPQMHIAFERSTWVHATSLTIQAPKDSPNTDGIHIQHSQNIIIDNIRIGTGDDCISIADGSSHINISKIDCGPGHGISIGSLGAKGKHETVQFVHVKDVSFTGTTNGVRIKTWQGGKGYARHITFERIVSNGSARPIIIDQYYCAHEHCTNQKSAVQVSDVLYDQISGTSDAEIAVKFACSKSLPCTNIFMRNITLHSTENGSKTSSICQNVRGLRNGEIIPNVPCLHEGDNLPIVNQNWSN
ncbi:probable polygalacturonase At3g15720 [Fagus crenata]